MSKTYTGRILLTHSTFKINFVVGDFFKSQKGEMAKWAKNASNLITWLCSKTIILSHLRQLRIEAGLTALGYTSCFNSVDGKLYGISTVARAATSA